MSSVKGSWKSTNRAVFCDFTGARLLKPQHSGFALSVTHGLAAQTNAAWNVLAQNCGTIVCYRLHCFYCTYEILCSSENIMVCIALNRDF